MARRQGMTFLEWLKRQLQRNEVAVVWGWLGVCSFALSFLCLFRVRRLQNVLSHDHTEKFEASRSLIFIIVVNIPLFLLHMSVVFCPLWLRTCRFIRTTPSPFIIALGCVVTSYLPLACTIEGSLSDESLDRYSLAATVSYGVDFFCLQMAILPVYDYMFVHMTLSISATVVLSLTAGGSTLRRLWIGIAGFVTLVVLTVHHWLTPPASALEFAPVVYDARLGQYPPIIVGMEEVIGDGDHPPDETFRAMVQRLCTSESFGSDASRIVVGIFIFIGFIQLYVSFTH